METLNIPQNLLSLEIEIAYLIKDGFELSDIIETHKMSEYWISETYNRLINEKETNENEDRILDLEKELVFMYGGKYSHPKNGLCIRIANHPASLKYYYSETMYSFVCGWSKKQTELSNEYEFDISEMSLDEAESLIDSIIDKFEEIEEED